jgi:hypothetical protein
MSIRVFKLILFIVHKYSAVVVNETHNGCIPLCGFEKLKDVIEDPEIVGS